MHRARGCSASRPVPSPRCACREHGTYPAGEAEHDPTHFKPTEMRFSCLFHQELRCNLQIRGLDTTCAADEEAKARLRTVNTLLLRSVRNVVQFRSDVANAIVGTVGKGGATMGRSHSALDFWLLLVVRDACSSSLASQVETVLRKLLQTNPVFPSLFVEALYEQAVPLSTYLSSIISLAAVSFLPHQLCDVSLT